AAATRPGPMLTLEGGNGRPRVELRPECVLGVPQSGRTALGDVPDPRGGRQSRALPQPRRRKTFAFEAARGVSRLRDGDEPRPSGKFPLRGEGQGLAGHTRRSLLTDYYPHYSLLSTCIWEASVHFLLAESLVISVGPGHGASSDVPIG